MTCNSQSLLGNCKKQFWYKRHAPNNSYKNFVTTHIKVAAECKPKAKCRVLWESKSVKKEWDSIKK